MSNNVKFLNTVIGERIDRPDFDFQASEGPIRQQSAYAAITAVGAATTVGTIVRGFATTSTAANTEITVTRGTSGAAILGLRINGEVLRGFAVCDGALTKSVNITGLPNLSGGATYTVWIRAVLNTDEFENRFQWNATAATPAEFVSSVATRLASDWEVSVAATSPGDEWTSIADFQKVGGIITVLRDRRPFLYGPGGGIEGGEVTNQTVGSADFTASAVGSAQNAAGDAYQWNKAVMGQFEDIVGNTFWRAPANSGTTAGIGPRSLASLNFDKLGRSLEQTVTGTTWTWAPTTSTDTTSMVWNSNGTNSWTLTHVPTTGLATLASDGATLLSSTTATTITAGTNMRLTPDNGTFTVKPNTAGLTANNAVIKPGGATGSLAGFQSSGSYGWVGNSVPSGFDVNGPLALKSTGLIEIAGSSVKVGPASSVSIVNLYWVSGTIGPATSGAALQTTEAYDISNGAGFSTALPSGVFVTDVSMVVATAIPAFADSGVPIDASSVYMSNTNEISIVWSSDSAWGGAVPTALCRFLIAEILPGSGVVDTSVQTAALGSA